MGPASRGAAPARLTGSAAPVVVRCRDQPPAERRRGSSAGGLASGCPRWTVTVRSSASDAGRWLARSARWSERQAGCQGGDGWSGRRCDPPVSGWGWWFRTLGVKWMVTGGRRSSAGQGGGIRPTLAASTPVTVVGAHAVDASRLIASPVGVRGRRPTSPDTSHNASPEPDESTPSISPLTPLGASLGRIGRAGGRPSGGSAKHFR